MSLFKKKKNTVVVIEKEVPVITTVIKEVPVMSKDMIEAQIAVLRSDLDRLYEKCWAKGGYWNQADLREYSNKADLYCKYNGGKADIWLEMYHHHFEELPSIWEYNRRHPEEDVLKKDYV